MYRIKRSHLTFISLLLILFIVSNFQIAYAQELQLTLTEGTIRIMDSELFYRKGGNGPPLLLIHGFTHTGLQWSPFLDDLGKDYTVIVPDLPGHGNSSWLSEEFTYHETAKAIFVLFDSLEIDQIKAIGHSAGSNTLVHMSVQQPNRVEAMVLIAGAHRLTVRAREILREFRLANVDEAVQAYYRKHHNDDQQIQSIMTELRALADNYKDFDFSPEHLGLIQARTLLIWGDRDPFYPIEIGLEMYRAIKEVAFWIIPGQGHFPIWEWLGGSPYATMVFPKVVRDFFEKEENN